MVFAAAIDGAWIAVTMSEPLVMVSVISSALTLSRPLARLVMYAASSKVSMLARIVAVKTIVARVGKDGGAGGVVD